MEHSDFDGSGGCAGGTGKEGLRVGLRDGSKNGQGFPKKAA